MTLKYRLVVFDWEGTLSDTLGQVLACVSEQALRLHYGSFDENLARQSVDLGLIHAVKRVFPHLTMAQHHTLITAVQQALASHNGMVYLVPNAYQFVMRLYEKGVKLAIATNKSTQSFQRVLAASGLESFFSTTRSASQAPLKPDSTMLREIIEEMDVPAAETLVIGDSAADIEMATNLGVDAIGVNVEHRDTSFLNSAGAMAVFDNYQALADYIHLGRL